MTVRILVGDVRERLAELPDGSVQCCVTSPPYFGLRDYGTAQWDGGDPACDHSPARREPGEAKASTLGGGKTVIYAQELGAGAYRDQCGKCGAMRIDAQIGLEPTLAEYVETMVAVFREVRRVLRDDGTVWLNLGDSYAGNNNGYAGDQNPSNQNGLTAARPIHHGSGRSQRKTTGNGLKPKDLMMVPARVALALQDDGWWLRSHIIWAKRNCMPESVTDRPTSSHESIFLLTKSARYFYDAEAVREEAEPYRVKQPDGWDTGEGAHGSFHRNGREKGVTTDEIRTGRNQRNVWHLAQPMAHLRDDLTDEQRAYVFERLAAHARRGLP